MSPTGEILSYNRRFAEQWGFDEALLRTNSDDAALAEAVNQLVDPDAFMARVKYLYDHPDERSTDELRFHDGRVLERFSAPVRDADGTYLGRVWSFRDFTERVRAEAALATRAREQSALYRFTDQLHRASSLNDVYEAAVDAILDGIGCDRASLLLFDENDFMAFVASRGLSDHYRRAVEGHTPWTPDQADAEPIGVEDIAGSDLEPELKEIVLGEGIGAFGFIPLLGEGRLIGKFMVYYDRPHRFGEEELGLALAIARQIAFGIQRMRAETERERAEDALRDADRRKDEFLATLAHELRNPLAAIRNALSLVDMKLAAGEDVSRLTAVLARQSDRLSRLVDDLMDVSRITRGHVELRREEVDLRGVVSRALDAATEQAEPDSHDISADVPADPVLVVGDAVRLEQVVHNLVANALKYTDSGGRVTIAVRANGTQAEVSVRDTGIGIEPAFLPHVFELFRQADRSLDRAQGGLGIGLTVACRLAELHGGRIDVHSDGLGTGSEFVVRLPRLEAHDAKPAPGGTPAPIQAPAAGVTHRRVLVVDDNRDQTEVMAELVERLGHSVRVASDGEEALRLAREVVPDVVLLDIGLPGISGYDVARALRDDPATATAFIVALTGYGQASDREQSAVAGFDAHFVKPIDLPALTNLLATRSAPRSRRDP